MRWRRSVVFAIGRVALPAAAASRATVSWGKEGMKLSSTGPSSTLPSFFFMAGAEEGGDIYGGFNFTGGRGAPDPFDVKTSCPEDVFDNASPDLRVPKLPWRLQESWGCEREPAEVDVLVLENDRLRAAIAPQWGGKVWSLRDKKRGRDVVFRNPAHQPANIGYLKAWTSGGIEWNWSPGHVGHSVFTESPVWTAVLETELGPLVRVWEFDRLNYTVWQVDVLLVEDELFVHPKITNPTGADLPGYWWTCVAMTVDGPKTRVVTPAEISIEGGGQCAPWPHGNVWLPNAGFKGADLKGCAARQSCAWQEDLSFLGNIPMANDFFMRIEAAPVPYLAHVQEDGYAVIHSHPKWLNGTKFFQWGFSEHGTFNQDFLSAADYEHPHCNPDAYDPHCPHYEHVGQYTELQVGPARTQMHVFELPSESSLEWTEWFKAWQAVPEVMQDANYTAAVSAVETWLQSPNGMDDEELRKVDMILRNMADVPPTPDQIVSKGMPWGGLHQKLGKKVHGGKFRGGNIAPGCPFPPPETTSETQPWLELLEKGSFSSDTLSRTPVDFEVGDTWIGLLLQSIVTGNESWLHYLFLGTHALEAGNAVGAAGFFRRSMEWHPSVHAARNLAIIAPTRDEAVLLYMQAWSLWMELDLEADPNAKQLGADLSVEVAGWLLSNELWNDLDAFLKKLAVAEKSQSFLLTDRALHATAALAVHRGDFAKALPILRGNCFPTYGAMRDDLIQLWHKGNLQKETVAKGAPLNRNEKLALRKKLRCDGDSSIGSLDGPCVCGPPNLGYKY